MDVTAARLCVCVCDRPVCLVKAVDSTEEERAGRTQEEPEQEVMSLALWLRSAVVLEAERRRPPPP